MKRERNDKFGINMEKWCRDHEAWIEDGLARGEDPSALLIWHEKKLAWLQHERLVHLIVLVMTVFAELFVIGVAVFSPDKLLAIVLIYGILVVLIFYVRHYFVLENTVQRWYVLAEKLRDALPPQESSSGAQP